jgi:hypothetical protein
MISQLHWRCAHLLHTYYCKLNAFAVHHCVQRTTAQQGDNGSDDLDDDASDEGGAYGDNTEEEDRYFNYLNYTLQSLAVYTESNGLMYTL